MNADETAPPSAEEPIAPEGVPPPETTSGQTPAQIAYASAHRSVYAGFGDRLVAWSIDWVVLLVIRFAILLLWSATAVTIDSLGLTSRNLSMTGGVLILLSLYLTAWIYYAAFEASPLQATLGKIAMRQKVTDLDHARPTFLQASFRFFFRIISVITLGIGFLCICFTKRRQSLHDIGANCLVIRKGS